MLSKEMWREHVSSTWKKHTHIDVKGLAHSVDAQLTYS